jgi:metal-dependent HD superfamily phosphatase/phosphodiesterase
VDELHPYAMHELYSLVLSEKIIEKILEEHNFIKLYSKLIKRLRKIKIEYGDKAVNFKAIFIEKLQMSFYKLIRKREWADRE